MRTKLLLLCLCLHCVALLAQANEPLYRVTLKATPAFEIVGNAQLSFYPFSEQMGAMIRKGKVRRLVAHDAATVTLRSERPQEVLSQVFRQIGEQTGLKLGSASNSSTPPTAPVYFRQGVSDTAVITLLLVPAENGLFHLTCHYILDERPAGSNDGTPEAIAEMQETLRLLSADSTASTLPAKANLQNIKPGEYFRSPMLTNAPDGSGGFFPIAVLMLKKGGDYVVGFYRNENNNLTLMDQPVALTGTTSPFVTNLPADPSLPAGTPLRTDQMSMGLRANKAGGTGGYYLSLENGRVVKREF